MPYPFASPKLTLARAKQHIAELERQIEPLISEAARTYVIERDADGMNIHKILFTQWITDEASCTLFDIVGNLRATLDQVGYAAALSSGKKNARWTSFPFAERESDLESSIARNSKDLPPTVISLFREFKPFKGGNNTLWALNRLCNTKKHSSLVPISMGLGRISFGAACETGLGGIDQSFRTHWDAAKRELSLMRASPEIRLSDHVALTFTIAIDSIDVLHRKPLLETLHLLSGTVEGILWATEVESQRLRPFA
jgi:hypothetical protein